MDITVYIVKCSDGLYYTGQTNNLERRLKEHNAGTGGWTSYHYPCKLIYSFAVINRQHARHHEKYIKRMGAKKYLQLIAFKTKNANLLIGL